MTDATGQVAAIIPAAGSGTRLNSEVPKAFVELDGLTLLTRSALTLSTVVDVIVVAVPDGFTSQAAIALENVDAQIHIVLGGDNRQESVAAGLAVLPEDVDLVLVHDAARPLVPVSVVSDVVHALRDGAPAVIPVLPLTDTVKRVDSQGAVVETISREQLRRVQTPQGFHRDVLVQAHADPTHVATDDAGLVESAGVRVVTIPGSDQSLKITTPEDFKYAQMLLGSSS